MKWAEPSLIISILWSKLFSLSYDSFWSQKEKKGSENHMCPYDILDEIWRLFSNCAQVLLREEISKIAHAVIAHSQQECNKGCAKNILLIPVDPKDCVAETHFQPSVICEQKKKSNWPQVMGENQLISEDLLNEAPW
jgi:hypothetical protein